MINFKDVTFIVPIRFDSEDRRENFKISMNHILTYFDTNIIVLESDGVSNEDFVKSVSDKITYIFEKNEDKLFHRTRLLNVMTKSANTNIIVNYDVDVVFTPDQYVDAREMIINGYDLVFPYDGKFYDIKKEYFNYIKHGDFHLVELNKCTLFNANSVGGAFFFNKERYNQIGLENENFVSWGHEDWERVVRVEKMGYKLGRTNGILYHLTHSRTHNSSDKNPYIKFNQDEFNRVKSMSKDQLSMEINKWKWKI